MALTKVTLDVQGMHCASCVSRVERFLRKVEGVENAGVNLASNRAYVAYNPLKASPSALVAAIEKAGYNASQAASAEQSPTSHRTQFAERGNLVGAVVLSAPVLAVSMVVPSRPLWLDWALAALSAIVIFGFGRSIYAGAFRALVRGGSATMDTLIALGASAAYFFSLVQLVLARSAHLYFETGAVIVTLILLGRWLEAGARRRATNTIEMLMSLAPRTVRLVEGGTDRDVPVDSVHLGDLLRARPGDRIAADGIVVEGISDLDESLLTGESVPEMKRAGDSVVTGSINGSGTLLYQAQAIGENTMLAKVARLVSEAQGSKAPVQRLADRISAVFVPVVLGLSILTLLGWLLLSHCAVSVALIRAVSVLVIACPCAMGLATPTAIMVGTGRAAQLGILVRDGAALERAHAIKTVVFDKTGTLTQGRPTIVDVIALTGFDRDEVLQTAAAAESASEHPLGKSIVERAASEGLSPETPSAFTGVAGAGVLAQVAKKSVLVGSAKLLSHQGVELSAEAGYQITAVESEGKTAVIVAIDGRPAGVIAVSDKIRPDSKIAIERLRSMGISVAMLTGDSERAAAAVATQLGLDDVRWGVQPAEKASAITAWRHGGRVRVAMVGDGVNDAAAIAKADLGIAMGRATDVVLEAADITLLKAELMGVVRTITLSRHTMSTIRQNLFWAFAFNAVGIPLAALGHLNPMVAAGAMAFSSVAVVANSLRLRTAG